VSTKYVLDPITGKILPVEPGPAGPAGPQGPAGPAGSPGAPGTDGEDGDSGPPGPSGADGAQGPAGPSGPPGVQGPPGTDGTDGEDGASGPPGPAGSQGPPGAPGTTGATGASGPPGLDGEDGIDGELGPPGPTGATGPAGPAGAQGPQGLMMLAVDGEDGEWGPPGAPGATGAAGATGPTGPAGAMGPAGFGFDGDDGVDGIPGSTGLTPGAANSVFGVAGNQIANHADIPNAVGDGAFLQQQSNLLTWSQFTLPATITPSAITGTVNDYNPAGIATASTIRQPLSGSAILTGLLALANGRVIVIENIDTALALTLNNEDTGSAAANRFTLPGGTALIINPGGCVVLIYDGTSSRWRTIGQIGATVLVSSPVFGLFGDGSDGPIHFDGIATITLGNNGQTIVPSGNVYTLPRDIFPTTVVIDAGVAVNAAGFFIFAKTSANGPGTILCNGGAGGNGTTAGGAGGAGAFAGGRYNNAGLLGVAGSIAQGTIGLINNGAPNPSPIGGGGAASGGNGTKANASGAGGSSGGFAGGAGTGNNTSGANAGGYKVLDIVILGVGSGGTRFILTGCSGGSGAGNASVGGGGSGAGGGYVGLFTPVVLGPLTLQANGGNGGNGSTGGNSGGGGGGGGGYAFLLAIIGGSNVTIQVNGGTGGLGHGTGTNGGNGFTGQQIVF
jgi:hypothetical protein